MEDLMLDYLFPGRGRETRLGWGRDLCCWPIIRLPIKRKKPNHGQNKHRDDIPTIDHPQPEIWICALEFLYNVMRSKEEFENTRDPLSWISQPFAFLRTLHQIFGLLKTGMCNFTIFQNVLRPFSYYSSFFFACNKSGRGSETREWLVCLVFFSCQGYPAAVLLIIEKGNALVKWKTQRLWF